jgi:hypothetical protein
LLFLQKNWRIGNNPNFRTRPTLTAPLTVSSGFTRCTSSTCRPSLMKAGSRQPSITDKSSWADPVSFLLIVSFFSLSEFTMLKWKSKSRFGLCRRRPGILVGCPTGVISTNQKGLCSTTGRCSFQEKNLFLFNLTPILTRHNLTYRNLT